MCMIHLTCVGNVQKCECVCKAIWPTWKSVQHTTCSLGLCTYVEIWMIYHQSHAMPCDRYGSYGIYESSSPVLVQEILLIQDQDMLWKFQITCWEVQMPSICKKFELFFSCPSCRTSRFSSSDKYLALDFFFKYTGT